MDYPFLVPLVAATADAMSAAFVRQREQRERREQPGDPSEPDD
jgi:hypothetical protein